MSTFFFFFFVSLISILVSVGTCIGASDRILAGQSLFPNQTLISNGSRFELGFFSPDNSSNYYVGIWYTNIPDTVVWVANRNDPIPYSLYNNSRLQLSRSGTLQLIVSSDVIWDAETSTVTEAILLHYGELRLEGDDSGTQWRSRDYPTDTLVPYGFLGFHSYYDIGTKLVSWKNPNDPAEGDYSLGLELDSTSRYSQLYIYYNNSRKLWRDGIFFLGDASRQVTVGSNSSHTSDFYYSSGPGYMYLLYSSLNESVVSRIVMMYDGRLINYEWEEATREWNVLWVLPSGACGRYATCGDNAICDASVVPVCSCLAGFVP